MNTDDFLLPLLNLPVTGGAQSFQNATTPGSTLIVTAPPGSGKTTVLPVLLADLLPDGLTVLVTQPRRVAARAAARRIASLLGEKVGQSVGFSVRGEQATSTHTRIEFLTPGILLRRLMRDPELPGVGAVIIDEFHERHIDTDLSLAFLGDIRETLREDLRLVVMSATLNHLPLMELMADLSPTHLNIPGAVHPLEEQWAPPPRGVSPLHSPTRVTGEFLAHVARTTMRAHRDHEGDILVFLPGVAEIREVCDLMAADPQCAHTEVLPLHGALTPAEQDRIFTPADTRRIIVSTSLAESSVTVPRVRIVVDSTLARESRVDQGRDISALITLPASQDRCIQRAGRAAREGAGLVIRCMEASEWARRPSSSQPEICVGDSASALLMSAVWGAPMMTGLRLLDVPSPGVLSATALRLRSLGAIDEAGRATAHGERLATLPLSPQIAHAWEALSARFAAHEVARWVAYASADVRPPGADAAHAVRHLPSRVRAEIEREERRLARLAPSSTGTVSDLSLAEGCALACATAFPGRIARLSRGRVYRLVNGQSAVLPPASPLETTPWLAIADLQRGSGADALIRSAYPLEEERALEAAGALRSSRIEIAVESGLLRAARIEVMGGIELTRTPLSLRDVAAEDTYAALVHHLKDKGLQVLPWTRDAHQLRERLRVLHEVVGAPWPSVSDEALLSSLDEWGAVEIQRCVRTGRLDSFNVHSALQGLLPWPQAASFDALVPESITIPTGTQRRIDWSGEHPTVTLRVQEAFGWTASPSLVDGRIPLVCHLTDPAGRPVAVTADLASFWGEPYRQVRAQLRGRYPKHPWPENPLEAAPTSRAKPRR